MATVKGCNLPDDLYYNVENNVWARREADGMRVVVPDRHARVTHLELDRIAERRDAHHADRRAAQHPELERF